MPHDFFAKYIVACLRLGKHVEGIIDSYYGPPDLTELADSGHLKPLGEILLEFDELKKKIDSLSLDASRKVLLSKRLTALQTITREKMGVRTLYKEFVANTLDVQPMQVKYEAISELKTELQNLLRKKGHEGSLTEMLLEFRKRRLISGDRLGDIFNNMVIETRYHTQKMISLPPGEEVVLASVRDRPWSGYNHYLGNYKSRMEINIDVPITSTSLPIYVTHEVYPGHHTERTIKEWELYWRGKQPDSSIILINTPDCTISEGLADVSRKFILGEPSMMEDRIQALENKLRDQVRVNTALMIHDRHADMEEARKYLMEEAALPIKEVDQQMRFLLDPLWRGYTFTFCEGGRLVEDAWKRAKEAEKEVELLHILYREENCPTTFKDKVKKLLS